MSHHNYWSALQKLDCFCWKNNSKATSLKTGCLISKLLSEIKGNNFRAECGHWWIADDEMTRMSVNWMFDAGSNWMRGCEMRKANTLWNVLFYVVFIGGCMLVNNERWKLSVFPFEHIQGTCALRMNICDFYTLCHRLSSTSIFNPHKFVRWAFKKTKHAN